MYKLLEQKIIPSAVTTVDVDNIFTDDYKVYMVQFQGVYHDTNVSNGIEGIRFIDNAGSVITGSEYSYASFYMPDTGTFSENRYTSRDFIFFDLYTDQLSDGQGNSTMHIYNPSDSTSYTFLNAQSASLNSSGYSSGKTVGVHKSQETIRGFQLYESNVARTFGGGKINVYGVK